MLTSATISTVRALGPFLKSKSTPRVRCHRVLANQPPAASMIAPFAGGFLLQSAAIRGATYSGFSACTSSSGQIVRVMFVPAEGATTLTKMLYFAPSRAVVLVKPMIPAFCDLRQHSNSAVWRAGVTYCSGVIRLSKISVYAGGACNVHDASVSLLDHMRKCCFLDFVSSTQMHVDDLVPLVIGHVYEGFVAEYSGVVDHLDSNQYLISRMRCQLTISIRPKASSTA